MADLCELNRCRLCFTSNNLTDAIFPANGDPNEELIKKIYACTSIRISLERDFPCPVCSSCVRILNQFYSYRRKCVDNDRELKAIRGEKNVESDDDDQVHNQEEEDPLSCLSSPAARKQKTLTQPSGDKDFYGQVKKHIHNFLENKVREIERKALAKVNDALKRRSSGVNVDDLQMIFGKDYGDEHIESIGIDETNDLDSDEDYSECVRDEDTKNWKAKYLTLQRNNDHLQKAFREQKTKMKNTEETLKAYQQQGISPRLGVKSPGRIIKMECGNTRDLSDNWGGGFKPHSAFPEITVDFMKTLSFKSGPGEKGDRNFVSKLAVAVFGAETMAFSSVTGRPSNAHHNIPAKPPLCPQKIAAIGVKLFERVQLELGTSNQEELLARSHEKLVRLIVCQKSMNLRKHYVKQKRATVNGVRSEGASASGDADDDETEPPKRKKRSYR